MNSVNVVSGGTGCLNWARPGLWGREADQGICLSLPGALLNALLTLSTLTVTNSITAGAPLGAAGSPFLNFFDAGTG